MIGHSDASTCKTLLQFKSAWKLPAPSTQEVCSGSIDLLSCCEVLKRIRHTVGEDVLAVQVPIKLCHLSRLSKLQCSLPAEGDQQTIVAVVPTNSSSGSDRGERLRTTEWLDVVPSRTQQTGQPSLCHSKSWSTPPPTLLEVCAGYIWLYGLYEMYERESLVYFFGQPTSGSFLLSARIETNSALAFLLRHFQVGETNPAIAGACCPALLWFAACPGL